jgi:hypothetical protein
MTNTQKKIAHSIWRNQMIQKIICPECKGEGEVEYDHWSLRSFQKDVGEFVSKIENLRHMRRQWSSGGNRR